MNVFLIIKLLAGSIKRNFVRVHSLLLCCNAHMEYDFNALTLSNDEDGVADFVERFMEKDC